MQDTGVSLTTNPFLETETIPGAGRVTLAGQKLSRIQVPPIKTLVHKPTTMTGELINVNVNDVLTRAGVTPTQSVVVSNETYGIRLELNLLGIPSSSGTAQLTPADLQKGQNVGRYIPTNVREARDVLHKISPQRTGNKNDSFNISELKKIAKNLDLPSVGNKDVLAVNIRNYIIDYYNLPR
jgi:hypothetical protein